MRSIFLASLLLVSLLPSPVTAENSQCEMYLAHRLLDPNNNQLLLQHYSGLSWAQPSLVHSSASSFSYSSTVAADADGNLVIVWVEAQGRSSQLMYRVQSSAGAWLSDATELTASDGEKTTPILTRSVSGVVYLAWVSDQNGLDDVFLSHWSLADGWSDETVLSQDNAFPDITPEFEYVESVDGEFELLLLWQARSEDGVYAAEQHSLERKLRITPEHARVGDQCAKVLSQVDLPAELEEGFLHFPQSVLESYQRLRSR